MRRARDRDQLVVQLRASAHERERLDGLRGRAEEGDELGVARDEDAAISLDDHGVHAVSRFDEIAAADEDGDRLRHVADSSRAAPRRRGRGSCAGHPRRVRASTPQRGMGASPFWAMLTRNAHRRRTRGLRAVQTHFHQPTGVRLHAHRAADRPRDHRDPPGDRGSPVPRLEESCRRQRGEVQPSRRCVGGNGVRLRQRRARGRRRQQRGDQRLPGHDHGPPEGVRPRHQDRAADPGHRRAGRDADELLPQNRRLRAELEPPRTERRAHVVQEQHELRGAP